MIVHPELAPGDTYAITGREWSTSGGVRKIGHDAVLDGE
jgi:hypothetical protein